MLEWILLLIGLAGFGMGAYWDLRYTEFSEWLPYSMIVAALAVRGAFSFILADFSIIMDSLVWGAVFLFLGLALYYFRQWGDGDAWLLGALGFLFPTQTGFSPLVGSAMPFQVTMIFNFFIVALFYLAIYAVFLGVRSQGVRKNFYDKMRAEARKTAFFFFFLFAATILVTVYLGQIFSVPLSSLYGIFAMPFLAVAIYFFLHYAKIVEAGLFKKKIPASRLRAGDVLVSDKWRGLTEKEVKALKRKGGHVWIKEGVRFAPVFVICMVVTLFYGSLAVMLFSGVLFG